MPRAAGLQAVNPGFKYCMACNPGNVELPLSLAVSVGLLQTSYYSRAGLRLRGSTKYASQELV